jgi:Zn-dependent protease
MSLNYVEIFFQVVVFLFAISVHESAHAYVAWRCGDPTAYMLGRVTLNPIKHIDPFGTVILPLILIVLGLPVFGWAKPTPVNPRNFRSIVRSDILTSLAGPISNLLVAAASVLLLLLISKSGADGALVVKGMAAGGQVLDTGSPLVPIVVLLYESMLINVLLAVFNCIPVPPLDGSHVIRHFLSPPALRVYDMVGSFGIILLFLVGGRIIGTMMAPFLQFFNSLLMRF